MNFIVPPSLFRRNGGGGFNTFENRMIGQLRTDIEANKNVATDDWMYFNEPVIQAILDAGRLCQYCGLQLDEYTVSFDRIDNDNCHTASNVILTCAPCNITRSNQFTVEEFISTCENLRQFRKQAPVALPKIESLRSIVQNSKEFSDVMEKASTTISGEYIEDVESRFERALGDVIAEMELRVNKSKITDFVNNLHTNLGMLNPDGLNLYCFKSAADAFDLTYGRFNFHSMVIQHSKELLD